MLYINYITLWFADMKFALGHMLMSFSFQVIMAKSYFEGQYDLITVM